MQTRLRLRDGQRDFDFLFGTWHVHNRRLRHPLSGTDDWYEFEGTCTAQPVWNGKGNLDQYAADSPLGRLEGLTLRLYDAEYARWRLYWATPERGLTVVPNVGAFDAYGIGEFFSREMFERTPIVCRYRWSRSSDLSCRWEQAFSVDDGASWETNWVMDFVRT